MFEKGEKVYLVGSIVNGLLSNSAMTNGDIEWPNIIEDALNVSDEILRAIDLQEHEK